VYIPDEQFNALYDGGGILVFKRSVIPPPIKKIQETEDVYVTLAAGEFYPAPVAPDTNFNLLSFLGSSVNVNAYHPDGTPIEGKHYDLAADTATPGKGPVSGL